jgi:hypothetical protein
MELSKLSNMTKGWFVGDFLPTVVATQAVEVGVKKYVAGQREERHYHKIATEITLILSGHVRMNNQEFSDGDIVTIFPMESTDFEVLKDTVTVVVKLPGESNDKYLGKSPSEQ